MNNPMAKSEPVEQRFAAPESAEPVLRSTEGTDAIEKGSLKVEGVLEALRDVIDPEFGINIVDSGLVYGISIAQNDSIVLEVALTSAVCPLTDVIERQAQVVLSTLSPEVVISWVWIPPWGPDQITQSGCDQLRAIGSNVWTPRA